MGATSQELILRGRKRTLQVPTPVLQSPRHPHRSIGRRDRGPCATGGSVPECDGQLRFPVDMPAPWVATAGQVGMDSHKFHQDDNLEVWGEWAVEVAGDDPDAAAGHLDDGRESWRV